jgi:hypothetical protein
MTRETGEESGEEIDRETSEEGDSSERPARKEKKGK